MNAVEEYTPCHYEENELYTIGYYLMEYLRLGTRYGDDSMLLLSIPEEYRERIKKWLTSEANSQ